jgi:hypothetical protein
MSKSVDKTASDKSLLSVQNIVLAGVAWGVLALVFYLVFGTKSAGEELPSWYSFGTYVFEMVAFFCSTLLCLRNWRSPQIVSGRNVWLFIGAGTLLYFIGQGVFGYIELVMQEDPGVSLADIFFVPAYLCFVTGMVLAVFSKRLSLEIWQWLIVASIGILGIAAAVWLTIGGQPPATALSSYTDSLITRIQIVRSQLAKDLPILTPPANAQQAPPAAPPATPKPPARSPAATPKAQPTSPKAPAPATPKAPAPTVKPTAAAQTPKPNAPAPESSPQPTSGVPTVPSSPAPLATPEAPEAPEEQPSMVQIAVKTFYLAADVALLVMATTLLLAFWGGRFSTSWRMIAAAAFSFYVSDLYFNISSSSPDYQSGGVFEVGWVLSGVLFGLGAALEYDLSTRSRRSSRRRA